MNYNLQTIKFLRNKTISDRATAKASIADYVSKSKINLDGSAVLGRYIDNETTHTLIGLVYGSGSTATITYLDNHEIEQSITDLGNDITAITATTIATKIQEAINKLDVTDTAQTGKYVSAVSEADGKITVSRADIPVTGVSTTTVAHQVVTGITLSNHQVQASLKQLAAEDILVKTGATETVSTKLDNLDKKTSGVTNAKVSLSASTTDTSLAKKYTIYQGTDKVGEIDIPKDLFLKSGAVVKGTWNGDTFTESTSGKDTALKLELNTTDATAKPIYINVATLVDIYSGSTSITVADNKISVKLDTTAADAKLLTVTDNGLALAGVTALISSTSAATKSEIVGKSTDSQDALTIYGAKSYTDAKIAEQAGKALAIKGGKSVTLTTQTEGETTYSVINVTTPDASEAIKLSEGDSSKLYLDFENSTKQYFENITFECGTF